MPDTAAAAPSAAETATDAALERAAHTPGEWRVEEGTFLIWGECEPGEDGRLGIPVAECDRRPRSWGRPVSDAERAANAHLIAAAPDLLAALRDMVDRFGVDAASAAPEVQRALAAIAKAGGR